VWLTTVIAPLGSALGVEQRWVARGDWSFRCETQDFEFLWPTRKMVAVPYLPNLEQVLRYRGDLKKLTQAHDDTLASLREAARRTYDRVMQDEQFRQLAASNALEVVASRYAAEYIVNGVRDLASYYTYHEVWNREGARFLMLRERPSLKNEFRSLEACGRAFGQSVDALLGAVSGLQIELADRYRLPPVEPLDAVRV
jgi:hypothetical protein